MHILTFQTYVFTLLYLIMAVIVCFCINRILTRIFGSLQMQINLKPEHQSFSSAKLLHSGGAAKILMEPKLYQSPVEVRGMTSLNKDAFTHTITVPALRVPIGVLHKVLKSLKRSAFKRPNVPRVVQDKDGSDGFRLLLLDPHIVSSASSFSEAEAEALRSFSVAEELQNYELKLTYDNLKSSEVLEAVLPQGQEVASGFSRVGHIAHLNLRDHQLPYKNVIGEVDTQLILK